MLIPGLTELADVVLLLLRLMIAVLFGTSGWSHMTKPKERAESIGMSPTFTLTLGVVEVLGALSVALGVYPQIGAAALAAVMLGAVQKKLFVWRTGFWGQSSQGWYYDLLYLVCNLVIVTTGGGSLRLW